MEFISKSTPPRLGNLVLHPPKETKEVVSEVGPIDATGTQVEATA